MALGDSTQSERWGNPSFWHGGVTNQGVEVEVWIGFSSINVDVSERRPRRPREDNLETTYTASH